jgi:hypothetical protein
LGWDCCGALNSVFEFQGQSSGIEIASAQHGTRRSACVATIPMLRDELGLKLLRGRLRDAERWNEWLSGRQTYEEISPHAI